MGVQVRLGQQTQGPLVGPEPSPDLKAGEVPPAQGSDDGPIDPSLARRLSVPGQLVHQIQFRSLLEGDSWLAECGLE